MYIFSPQALLSELFLGLIFLVKDENQRTRLKKKAALLLFFVGTGFTLRRPAVNTAIMAAYFPSLFSVW
jgi:hypothetical protein